MAQRPQLHPPGTPQRILQEAVDERYERLETFFEQIAEKLNITPASASGTFYGFLRGDRPLPLPHRRLYLEFTTVTEQVIDNIAALRPAKLPTSRRSLIEQQVVAMRGVVVQLAEEQGLEVPEVLLRR